LFPRFPVQLHCIVFTSGINFLLSGIFVQLHTLVSGLFSTPAAFGLSALLHTLTSGSVLLGALFLLSVLFSTFSFNFRFAPPSSELVMLFPASCFCSGTFTIFSCRLAPLCLPVS